MPTNRVKLKFKRDGLYQIRRAPGVQADLLARAEKIARACGPDYLVSSTQGRKNPQGRWRAAVFTSNFAAILDNHRHNTLVRNFGRARG